MSDWSNEDLRRVGDTEELQIAAVRREGALRRPATVWVVRSGDDLYVRAAYGPATGWHRVASATRRARISAGGVEADVSVEDVDDGLLHEIDAAYRRKYGHYAKNIVDSVTDAQARATTLRLVPVPS
jgi:hypothetical protein